jgi:hypothetical protein
VYGNPPPEGVTLKLTVAPWQTVPGVTLLTDDNGVIETVVLPDAVQPKEFITIAV